MCVPPRRVWDLLVFQCWESVAGRQGQAVLKITNCSSRLEVGAQGSGTGISQGSGNCRLDLELCKSWILSSALLEVPHLCAAGCERCVLLQVWALCLQVVTLPVTSQRRVWDAPSSVLSLEIILPSCPCAPDEEFLDSEHLQSLSTLGFHILGFQLTLFQADELLRLDLPA